MERVVGDLPQPRAPEHAEVRNPVTESAQIELDTETCLTPLSRARLLVGRGRSRRRRRGDHDHPGDDRSALSDRERDEDLRRGVARQIVGEERSLSTRRRHYLALDRSATSLARASFYVRVVL
jgi:hypothetical protein